MELLTPLLTGALLAVFTVVLTWITKAQFDTQRGENDRRFSQLERRLDQLTSEIAVLRSDLTQIALAVGARRPQTG